LSIAADTVDEDEAAPRPGLALRLKRLLAAPLLLLRRLRRPPSEDVVEEAPPGRADDRRREKDEGAEEAAEAPAGLPPWRRALPSLLAALAGAAIAGGAAAWLSAQVVSRQSAELGAQGEEITRLKGVLAGYDKMMLQNKKRLDTEQGRRAEAENRLSQAQTDLLRQPPPRENTGAASSAGAGRQAGSMAADCTLKPGSVGSALKSCLDEFNKP
jgi:hypothetical protein